MNIQLTTILLTERSRRGSRGVLQELKGQLGLNSRLPETTGEWMGEIASRYGWPTVRLVAILLCSHPVGAFRETPLVLVESARDKNLAKDVDEARWTPLMGWIGREVHRLWTRIRSGARRKEYGRVLESAIFSIDVETPMRVSSEKVSMRDIRRWLWLPQEASLGETRIGADLFRQLPEIRDWYEANHPRLSKYTMEQAARAAEDWHHGLHGGVVLPRGSVRRGELVLVHPDSDVNDPDGFWTIQRLTSRHQYEDEGRALRHCVGGGGYWVQHEIGNTEIYSVRDEHGDPVLTIEVTVQHDDGVVIPKSIEQIKGKNNEVPLRIIAREQTSSGHDVSMALSGAQALIDHLRAIAEEHDETLELCSDVAGMRLHDPDDSFMDDIASGDVLMDQAMASAIAELVHDNYNQNLVRAWAQATEDGHSEYLAPVIAWEQMGIVEEMRPPSMVNLEDWVHERHGRYLERSGDGDEISPWVMLFEEDLVSPSDPTAKITIRGVCWIGFSGESDWDVSSDWYLLTHSELRYEDADGSFETPGFEDFEERHSPERALEHSTHTGKNLDGTEKKYTYTSWDELDLLSSFTHVSHPSIWKVASGDPGPQLRPIIERMDDWIRDGALYEALDELNIAQERAVVTGPFRDELSRLWKLAADDRLLANGKTAIARANARAEEKAAAKAAKDGET